MSRGSRVRSVASSRSQGGSRVQAPQTNLDVMFALIAARKVGYADQKAEGRSILVKAAAGEIEPCITPGGFIPAELGSLQRVRGC